MGKYMLLPIYVVSTKQPKEVLFDIDRIYHIESICDGQVTKVCQGHKAPGEGYQGWNVLIGYDDFWEFYLGTMHGAEEQRNYYDYGFRRVKKRRIVKRRKTGWE